MTPRRSAAGTGLASLAAGALLLLAGSASWATGSGRRPAGSSFVLESARVTGRAVVPAVAAAGFVGLAGAVAVPATRRWGRRVAGALMLVAGAVAAQQAPAGRGAAASQVRRQLPPGAAVHGSPWPWLALAAGVLLAAAGLLLAARGPGWASLSARYEPRPDRPAAGGPGGDDAWDQLDRGQDPTAEHPPPGN